MYSENATSTILLTLEWLILNISPLVQLVELFF